MGAVSTEEVWVLATKYAPGLCRKFHVKPEKYSPEDLCSDFMVKFLKSKFGEKFDPAIRSLESYIYSGMTNHVISHLRRKDPAKFAASADEDKSKDGTGFFVDLVAPEAVEMSDSLVREILTLIPEKRFGYGVICEVGGEVYASTTKSLAILTFQGYTRTELAEFFRVTPSRVGQLLHFAFAGVNREMITGVA